MSLRRVGLVVVVAVALSLLPMAPERAVAGTSAAAQKKRAAKYPTVRVLSNRADLVAGGEAHVEITYPPGARRARSWVLLNGRSVAAVFRSPAKRRFTGVVDGLRQGDNTLEVRASSGSGARLTITNHPIGGPVFSGPQIQPWKCFPGAQDRQCNRRAQFAFFYRSTAGGPLRSYDPDNPPADVATTRTDQGRTVPFIVRQETGTIARDQYRIAVLYDPRKPWSPTAPQAGFNHKLVIFHGASCDTGYEQAQAPDVLNATALGRGFATMSHALDNAGHNCNIVTQAESLVMTKEHLIDRYGTVRYTIGSGCSGGALTQQQVANAYPGLYQGITPGCSFPDAWSSAMQYVDYQGLRRYYENPAGWGLGVAWSPDQIAAVQGHASPLNAITFTSVIPSSGDPSRSCPGVPADQVYDAQRNPKGVRCSFHDYMVNVFGRRPQDGFAGRPADNVGIEYGRKALVSGAISPAQFVDVNAKLGGFDIDYNPTAARAAADRPALERVYRSGAVNQADNLDETAIIDVRGPDPGAFHDVYRTAVMRARLDREHGTHANQVLWEGQAPILGDSQFVDQSIVAMDEWLARIERDGRNVPLARKVIEDKPAGLKDRCTDGAGTDVSASVCDATVTAYGDPRLVAGMPMADDTIKCELRPLERSSYPVAFTDAQWAELQRAFPSGVCDYSKRGVDRTPTARWQTYQDRSGKVIFGGRPLGAEPAAATFGCLSHRSPIGPRNIGRVRLGLTRKQLAPRVPGASSQRRRTSRWCVRFSRGSVRAALTRRGRVALVATTAARHGNRGVRPGRSSRSLRAYPRRKRIGRGLYRATSRSPRLIGVRRGRVRFIAVTSRGVMGNRAVLRRYLRLAGVR